MAEIFVRPKPTPANRVLVEMILEEKPPPGIEIPKPQRIHTVESPYPILRSVDYNRRVYHVNGLYPPEDFCVCAICAKYECDCLRVHGWPNDEQIDACIVHGKGQLLGEIYRAAQTAHQIAINRDIEYYGADLDDW